MSFLGEQHCKFTGGISDVEIQYSLLDPTYLSPEVAEQRSALTGNRLFIARGSRAHFSVFVHLFKYNDPAAKLSELMDYEGLVINAFYPFADGDPIKTRSGENARFMILNVKPFYLTNRNQYDVCLITLISIEYSVIFASTDNAGYGIYYGNRYKA